MTLSTQRTLFNTDLHLAMLFGAKYSTLPHTTLNEKWSISNELDPTKIGRLSEYPTIRYLCIGTGGNPGINSSNGFILSEHSPIDAALFNQVPFAMYEDGTDMNPDRQSNYRFKKKVTLSTGKAYTCYYLRMIEDINSVYDNKFQTIKNVGSETFISAFNTDINMLNPVPRNKMIKYDKITETDFITKLCKIKVTFQKEELDDLANVLKILNKGSNVLTEMGLCTGIETYNKETKESLEPEDVQLMFYLDLNLDLTYNFNSGKSFTKYIEVGGAEPLLRGQEKTTG